MFHMSGNTPDSRADDDGDDRSDDDHDVDDDDGDERCQSNDDGDGVVMTIMLMMAMMMALLMMMMLLMVLLLKNMASLVTVRWQLLEIRYLVRVVVAILMTSMHVPSKTSTRDMVSGCSCNNRSDELCLTDQSD